MRILGVDYGERRIGLAVSDPTGTIATPLPTLKRRRGKRPPYRAIEELAGEKGVEAVVVGLPLELSGEESEWTREVREVGGKLADRLEVPVYYVDERMTSVRAERAVRGSGLPRGERERKERIDRAAAVLILQRFLDSGVRPGQDEGESPDPGVVRGRGERAGSGGPEAKGADGEGTGPGGAETEVAETDGAETESAETESAETEGAERERTGGGGAGSE